jgi:GGDEF domain-containing protein
VKRLLEELPALARTDPLTRIANRRAFKQDWKNMIRHEVVAG